MALQLYFTLFYLIETLEKKILWAANEGQINEIQEILKLDPGCVKSTDEDGYTPLHRYLSIVDFAFNYFNFFKGMLQ